MKRTILATLFFGIITTLTSSPALAAGAVRIPSVEAPVIDGDINDPAWKEAASFSEFRTMKPDFGQPPSERTEVLLACDRDNLYVAIRSFDHEPGKIKATVARRDSVVNDDWVAFCLDAANDHLSAYAFIVNPLGIQMDGTLNSRADFDPQFDAVWVSAGKMLDDGYAVEMAIPFQTLRYPQRKSVVMGFKVARNISRKSEEVDFPEFSPSRGAALAQFQKIELFGIESEPLREVIPAFTFGRVSSRENGSFGAPQNQADLGLSAKLALTPDLVLEATYNPDFSQVETDAGQIDVNLRSSLFYPEKRPFFMEGNENFGFAATENDSPLGAVVHTRTIVEPGFGVKLGGKIGGKDRLSLLFASDDYPGLTPEGQSEERTRGRSAYFSILRYARSLKDDSYLGGFLVNRDFAGDYNRVVGSDGRFRLSGRSVLEYHAFGSFSRNDGGKDRTGSAAAAVYRYGSQHFFFNAGVDDVSKDFEVDSGYLNRSGITRFPVSASYNVQTGYRWFQKVEPFYSGRPARDQFSGLFENNNRFGANLFFTRQTILTVSKVVANEVFSGRRFSRDGFALEGQTQIWKQLHLEFGYRKGRMVYYDPANPFQGKGTEASVGLTLQPTEKLSSTIEVSYSDFYSEKDDAKVYDYAICRNRTIFQLNRYLFLRGVVEYNAYWKRLNTDALVSFTYVPGTVLYAGYGSIYEKTRWEQEHYVPSQDFEQTKKSFFFKASYLWRF